jgi:RNA polymerase sigma factor (sigma-70 family)
VRRERSAAEAGPGKQGERGVAAAAQLYEDHSITDEQLLEELLTGNEQAFDELYDRYFKRVYHFTEKRLRNRADAEETTQEVFINVLSSAHSFRGDAPFAAWVFGITRRTIAGRFKRKRHATVPLTDQEPLSGASGGPAMEPSPLDIYEFRERVSHLNNNMDSRLSKAQRTVFELHHLEHQPISVIAAQLGRSEDSVKSHLYRARRQLLQD